MGDKTSAKAKQIRSSVCEVCTSSYQCGKLSSALEILKQAVSRGDEVTREDYAALYDELRKAGYAYPIGVDFCDLKGESSEINDLIERATKLLSHIHKSKLETAG